MPVKIFSSFSKQSNSNSENKIETDIKTPEIEKLNLSTPEKINVKNWEGRSKTQNKHNTEKEGEREKFTFRFLTKKEC